MIPIMPHCDQRVLHAPGECQYCDHYPEWQELRTYWGIAFTGHDPILNKEHPRLSQVPCPSEIRGREDINHWPGNRASA